MLMIPRYTRPEMASIWQPQTRFRIWFEIEAHAADAQAELGVIPKEAARTIWAKGKNATFDVARIDEIERETRQIGRATSELQSRFDLVCRLLLEKKKKKKKTKK